MITKAIQPPARSTTDTVTVGITRTPRWGFAWPSRFLSARRPNALDGAASLIEDFRGLEPKGASANELDVSVWRSDPATYDYLFEKDEAFHVIEGAASIELPDTGERIELRAGDVAYFSAGTRSVWTITQPFKKFVVMPS